MYMDNKSAIDLARNPMFHGRSKHIDIHYHFIRDCVERGQIELKYVKKMINELIRLQRHCLLSSLRSCGVSRVSRVV